MAGSLSYHTALNAAYDRKLLPDGRNSRNEIGCVSLDDLRNLEVRLTERDAVMRAAAPNAPDASDTRLELGRVSGWSPISRFVVRDGQARAYHGPYPGAWSDRATVYQTAVDDVAVLTTLRGEFAGRLAMQTGTMTALETLRDKVVNFVDRMLGTDGRVVRRDDHSCKPIDIRNDDLFRYPIDTLNPHIQSMIDWRDGVPQREAAELMQRLANFRPRVDALPAER